MKTSPTEQKNFRPKIYRGVGADVASVMRGDRRLISKASETERWSTDARHLNHSEGREVYHRSRIAQARPTIPAEPFADEPSPDEHLSGRAVRRQVNNCLDVVRLREHVEGGERS